MFIENVDNPRQKDVMLGDTVMEIKPQFLFNVKATFGGSHNVIAKGKCHCVFPAPVIVTLF